MRLLFHRWVLALLCVLLTAGSFVALWHTALHRPDDAVREINIGLPNEHGWFLAEHSVEGKAYYTLRSQRGDTAWDKRYGIRPASLLFFSQGEDACLYLQRIDGTVLRLHLLTGEFTEAPLPSDPMLPLSRLFQ